MSHPKRVVCRMLIAVLVFALAPRARASAYDAHPKLVIVLVIDQFRGDYLDRYRADFKGDGFRLFLERGAYFEDCYYDYGNTKTAPGHATLATGAYTDGHGIPANEWWDLKRNTKRPVSSVEDERYHLVGMPAGGHVNMGASPFNLRASTIGDSLRLATQGASKVFGISLKDRAAILAAGFSANGAYWVNAASGAFITSSYYMAELPDWAATFNSSGRAAQAEQEAGRPAGNFLEAVGETPAANSYELDFARALIAGEQLGEHPVTDFLILSLSGNDLAGHRYGPDSPEEQEMVDTLDQQLDSFFTWLDKNVPGGLSGIWIALSADHGVAPAPAEATQLGLPAAEIDLDRFLASLNDSINAKFSPGEKVDYLLPQQQLPYLSLNQPSFEAAGINEQEAEQAVLNAVPAAVAAVAPSPAASQNAEEPPDQTSAQAAKPQAGSPTIPTTQGRAPEASNPAAPNQPPASQESAAPPPPLKRLPPVPIVVHAYSRVQLASGVLPPSEWGRLLAHSYSASGGWYVMVIPEAFQMQTLKHGSTHFSPWSYDRHVPLGFYGAPFTPGIYRGRVEPVDLAATLASLLGINQPSASIGNVLTQAIHKVAVPARGARHTHAGRTSPSPATTRRHAGAVEKEPKSP